MNQEPKTQLLRLRDVLAWQPNLTRQELLKWERAGLLRVRRVGKGRAWYYTEDLAAILGLGSAGNKNYRDRDGRRYV